jgi:hypothetical protein
MSQSELNLAETSLQYRVLLDGVRSAENNRGTTRRVFISLHLAIVAAEFFGIVMALVIMESDVASSISAGLAMPTLVLSLLGLVLCTYWFQEDSEWRNLHSARFRGLLELERQFSGRGPLEWEWEILGNDPNRRSPIFSVRLGRLLPFVFALAHLAGLGWGILLVVQA